MNVKPGEIVKQHPEGVGRYSFGATRLSVMRVRPRGNAAELRYRRESNGDLTVAGGIDGARYRVTDEENGTWFDIRVTSSVEKAASAVAPIESALISSGSSIEMSQFDTKLHAFVFPFSLKSHEVVIEAVKSLVSSELTYDLSQITDDRHRVIVRFVGALTAVGDRYRVTVVGESEGDLAQRQSMRADVSIKG